MLGVVEAVGVERPRRRGEALHRPRPLLERPQEQGHVAVRGAPRELEPRLGVVDHVVEVVPGAPAVQHDPRGGVARELVLAALDADAHRLARQRQVRRERPRPVVDVRREHVQRAAQLRGVSAAARDGHARAAEGVALRGVGGPRHHPVRHDGEGRLGGGPVARGEHHHPRGEPREQPGVAEVRRGHRAREGAHQGHRGGVRDLGHVGDALGRAAVEGAVDLGQRRGDVDGLAAVGDALAEEGRRGAREVDALGVAAVDGGGHHAQVEELGLRDQVGGAREGGVDEGVGEAVLPREVRAAGALGVDLERDLGGGDPGVVGQERGGEVEVAQGGAVGGGLAGLAAGAQGEVARGGALVGGGDAARPEAELVDDVEEAVVGVALGALEEDGRDAAVQGVAAAGVDAAVGGLLHAVVREREAGDRGGRAARGGRGGARALVRGGGDDEAALGRGEEGLDGVGEARAAHRGDEGEGEARADARGDLEGLAAGGRELVEVAEHERDDVVGDVEAQEGVGVPLPAAALVVEAQDLFGLHALQEALEEEGVALGARGHHPREVFDHLGRRVQRVGEEARHLGHREGREGHAGDRGPGVGHGLERGVQGRDGLSVAAAAQHQEAHGPARGEGALEELERRGVDPLHVVEGEHQGLGRARERGDQRGEESVQAVARLEGPDLGARRGVDAQHEAELGHDVDEGPGGGAQLAAEHLAPGPEPGLRLGEEPAHHGPNGLGEHAVGHGAVELVGLAGAVEARSVVEVAAHGAHEGALADARGARDDDELGAALAGAVEGGAQERERGLAAAQGGGHDEHRGHVAGGEGEGAHGAVFAEVAAHAAEVVGEGLGGLVALVGDLREELEHQVGEGEGHGRAALGGRRGAQGEVGVDERRGVVGGEGRGAGEELVEGGAEGVEVGAPVGDAGGAAGLLGGDVVEGADGARGGEEV
ncbi:MAG: hypothetical protein R3A52_22410 [Polyangiales bacterium]